MQENLLIITSSGGGGLLQSAIAIEQEQKKINPEINIVKRDLLMQWTGGAIGLFGRFFYNWTQRSGNVFWTNALTRGNLIADYIFYPIVFFAALTVLFRNKIDKVFDNQPMGLAPIIKALRIYNKLTKKNIVLQKVLVDLPTKEYAQLLKGIKKLSAKDKKWLHIFTIEPLLENERSYQEYWEKYGRISEEQITYKKYIIRESFKNFEKMPRPQNDFFVKIRSGDEKEIAEKIFSKGSIGYKENDEGFEFKIGSKDKLFVILLGSQPSPNAILGYVSNFIEEIKLFKGEKKYHLFVFCDKFSKEKKGNFQSVLDLIDSTADYPKNLTIVPMSFQRDDVIAPLFFRSDLTITRSGGHTIMEIMAIVKKEKWIHSETKNSDSFEELLKGIPFWEAGNARYLKKTMNGDIVSPDILRAKLQTKQVL